MGLKCQADIGGSSCGARTVEVMTVPDPNTSRSPQTPPSRTTSPSDAPASTDPPPSFNVSMTAVVAGAFAAVTSALIGSRLGTTGTLIGAALGSVIGAVATATYTWSIQRTVHVLKAVGPLRRGKASAGAQQTDTATPAPQDAGAAADHGTGAGAAKPTGRRGLSVRARWILAAVVATIVAFVVSLLIITGFERATGASLSGGQGTTIQQAGRPAPTPTMDDEPAGGSQPGPSVGPAADPQPSTSTSPSPIPTPTTDARASAGSAAGGDSPSPAPATSAPVSPKTQPEPTTVATEQAVAPREPVVPSAGRSSADASKTTR